MNHSDLKALLAKSEASLEEENTENMEVAGEEGKKRKSQEEMSKSGKTAKLNEDQSSQENVTFFQNFSKV